MFNRSRSLELASVLIQGHIFISGTNLRSILDIYYKDVTSLLHLQSFVFSRVTCKLEASILNFPAYMLLARQFLQKTTVARGLRGPRTGLFARKNESIEFSEFKFGIQITYTYSHIKVNMHNINSTKTTQLWRQNMEWGICIKTCFLLEIYSKTL